MPTQSGEQAGETMLLKILVVGALLVGLMAAIRDGRVLKDAGLLSTCNTVVVNGRQDSSVLSCSKGPPRRVPGHDEQVVQPDRGAPEARVLALRGAGRLVAVAAGMNSGNQASARPRDRA